MSVLHKTKSERKEIALAPSVFLRKEQRSLLKEIAGIYGPRLFLKNAAHCFWRLPSFKGSRFTWINGLSIYIADVAWKHFKPRFLFVMTIYVFIYILGELTIHINPRSLQFCWFTNETDSFQSLIKNLLLKVQNLKQSTVLRNVLSI